MGKIVKLIAVFILTASALFAYAESDNPQRGGTLIIGVDADFPTFDPLHMGALVERSVAQAFYETLFRLNERGELEPFLAEYYSVSDDGLIYNISLRQGITFHDGTDFNADAVVKNFSRLLDPANGCRCLSEISSVKTVKAVDTHRVQFILRESNASLPAVLADVSGMQLSPAALARGDFATRPVGTGPFRFVSWNRGVALRVERNPDYWQPGLPYLDGVTYRPIADNQTRMASVLAGDIQIATVAAPEDVAAVRRGRHLNLQVIEAPGLGTNFVMFNRKRPPFDDSRVIQALIAATDRETINKAINRDVLPLATNPFGAGLFGGQIENSYPAYDPERARKLLQDYGKPVSFKVTVNASPAAVRQALVLQQMWRRVGVTVAIEQLEQRQLVTQALNSGFDAMLFRWSGRADPDLNSYQFFHSTSSSNYTGFSNARVDELLERGRRTVDHGERVAIYRELGEALAWEGPYLFLTSANYFFITHTRVKNLVPVAGGVPQVDRVWLEKR